MKKKFKELTEKEEGIIKAIIDKNRVIIDKLVYKIDLLMNREGHERDSSLVQEMRDHLAILMAENNTFRKVYWKHLECIETGYESEYAEALRYMSHKIQVRQKAALHGIGLSSPSDKKKNTKK